MAKKIGFSECKNLTRNWLPIWNWPCPDFPNASVILLQASNEIASEMDVNASVSCPEYLATAVKELPGFTGMAYVMRDKQDLSLMKVGKASDAFVRMKKSPWTPVLGRINHDDRSEEMVIVCINVPTSVVERRLHVELGLPAFDKGCGREWFRSELVNFVQAMQNLTRDEGKRIWIEHDAISAAEIRNIRSLILLSVDDVFETFAGLGRINYVYRQPNGFDVVSSIWCPVQYYVAEHNIPMPFYALPADSDQTHLAAELRSFSVDSFDAEPDVIRDGNALISGSSCQRMHRIRRIGSVVPRRDPLLDVTRSEWEIDRDIYEIDYRIKVDVLERFRLDDTGNLRREGCEQIFQSG